MCGVPDLLPAVDFQEREAKETNQDPTIRIDGKTETRTRLP